MTEYRFRTGRRFKNCRVTFEDGKFFCVEKGKNVYLGWQVRDVDVKGLSSVSEVKGILREMDEDLKHGISPKTIQARSRILLLAVLHSSKMSKSEKRKAIELINEWRMKHGWRPFKLRRKL